MYTIYANAEVTGRSGRKPNDCLAKSSTSASSHLSSASDVRDARDRISKKLAGSSVDSADEQALLAGAPVTQMNSSARPMSNTASRC